MNHDTAYLISVIAVTSLITWMTRALPFFIFGKRRLPSVIVYLGHVFPVSIMVILVVYCLRGTTFSSPPFGIPEAVSCLLVFAAQKYLKNMYLSIIAGTVCYMFLIRL